ncbi:hypothetical protein SAMN05428989_2052 [Pseudoxanthomonas sp. GM95]|uniref:hypothetical protein n=1 Tax=Pseudoxanthomonas sp. GM95 TaxID=1881043 RepID=UPI0008C0F911|nr:hypothetical protein [Pseudoxanthomonas sp. GM95]SEL60866.1 hypothetical protein SAMN05428989_2052 [Pseudoxanthomonas sp. GM95]
MSSFSRLRRRALAATLATAGLSLSAVASAQTAPAAPPVPCAADANYHQLDFLIGDWEAFKPDGEKHAETVIAPALDGCVLTFTWQPVKADAQHGTGFFTYSRLRKQLMFLYAGNKGSETAALRSEGKDGDIGLFVEYPSPSGKGTAVRRMGLKLMPDGTIHETQKVSDNGGAFKQTFEAVWKKKQAELGDMGDRP